MIVFKISFLKESLLGGAIRTYQFLLEMQDALKIKILTNLISFYKRKKSDAFVKEYYI